MSARVTPRRGVFGHADERPYRRLVGDWIRLVLAAALVAVSAANPEFLRATERALDAFFAALPGSLDGLFEVLLAVGYLWGLALVALAALAARRYRLAAVIAAGGLAAWGIARFVGFAVDGESAWSALGSVFSSDEPGHYPAVRLAVLAAVVCVAGPFLTRPVRRLGQLALLVVVPGTIIVGLGGVDDVVGALGIGWGVAAILHLALGSPAGRPTMAQVTAALDELGVATTSVELVPEQPRGSTVVAAREVDGRPLRVRVYGRDAADTQLVAKTWRFLAYKDSGPTLTLTRLQQVEHEAVCLYAAQRRRRRRARDRRRRRRGAVGRAARAGSTRATHVRHGRGGARARLRRVPRSGRTCAASATRAWRTARSTVSTCWSVTQMSTHRRLRPRLDLGVRCPPRSRRRPGAGHDRASHRRRPGRRARGRGAAPRRAARRAAVPLPPGAQPGDRAAPSRHRRASSTS